MVLKLNSTDQFVLSMNLHINYELKYIEVTVTLRNITKSSIQTKTFSAADFDKALAYYDQQEKLFL